MNIAKIIFINRFFYPDESATSQILTDLVFSLKQEKYSIHIITSQQTYHNTKEKLQAKEIKNHVVIHRVWTTGFGRKQLIGRSIDYFSFYISSFFKLLQLTSQYDIIVAKTDPPLISIIALWISQWKKAKLVNWLQDIFPEIAYHLKVPFIKGIFYKFLLSLRNQSLKKAAMNIVLGEKMQEHLLALGIPETHITIIPNWADGDILHPVAKKDNPLIKQWDLENKFIISYSGNLGKAHSFEIALAAGEYFKSHPNIVFLWIGGGAQYQFLQEYAKQQCFENWLFKPYQEKSLVLYSLNVADIHLVSLLPELEGLIVPSKFYSISAIGRPIIFIGNPSGEIANLVQKHHLGATVTTPEAFIDYINMLYQNADMRETIGYNARYSFEQYFNKSLVIEKWQLLLEQLLQHGE